MKSIVKRIAYLFLFLLLTAVIFCFLQPVSQAKLFLSCIGIHNNNTVTFQDFVRVIKEEELTEYKILDSLPERQQQLLVQYHKGNAYVRKKENLNLSDIYARNGDEWNVGCNLDLELPCSKFISAFCSNKYIILISNGGGSFGTIWFELFETLDDKLMRKNLISHFDGDLFHLALFLRFDDKMSGSDFNNRF